MYGKFYFDRQGCRPTLTDHECVAVAALALDGRISISIGNGSAGIFGRYSLLYDDRSDALAIRIFPLHEGIRIGPSAQSCEESWLLFARTCAEPETIGLKGIVAESEKWNNSAKDIGGWHAHAAKIRHEQ